MSGTHNGVKRRTILKAMGAGGVAAIGGAAFVHRTVAQDSGGSGRLVLATVTQEDADQDVFLSQLELFTEQTGIEVETRFYPLEQHANSIQLLFAQDDPPDVFRHGGTSIQHPVSFQRGWSRPITEFVTDEYISRFPEGSFNPAISGIHVGEEIYATPQVVGPGVYLVFNRGLLAEAGFPEGPTTWSEFVAAAQQITSESDGAYGFGVFGEDGLAAARFQLESTAGPGLSTAGINLQSGVVSTAAPHVVETVRMLQDLNASGAFIPGWETLNEPQLYTSFAQEQVAMYFAAHWNLEEIRKLNPELDIGIVPIPTPDAGRQGYATIAGAFLPFWSVSSAAQDPASAWRLLDFFGSPDFQRAYFEQLVEIPSVRFEFYQDILDPDTARYLELLDQTTRIGPLPTSKNVNASQLLGEIVAAETSPTFGQILSSAVIEGQDYAQLASQYDAAMNQVIDQQVAEAQQAGLDIMRDALVFPNWNPMEDYAGEVAGAAPAMATPVAATPEA